MSGESVKLPKLINLKTIIQTKEMQMVNHILQHPI
jgi:hypothetical protein